MWNGAEAILKPRPTNMSAYATYAMTEIWCLSAAPISGIEVDPVAPNISAMPYRKNVVANDPNRKYLSDDSALPASHRRNPARMHVEIDEISSAMKISTSSTADDISAIPTVPRRISAKYSPT